MDPLFHNATPTDFPQLQNFMRDFYAALHLPFGEPQLAAMQSLLADSSIGHAYLILDGGSPAGYFVLTFSFSLERGGKTALLDELFIATPFRNRGLASAALHFAANTAKRERCSHLLLEVDHANPAAHSLYSREGFITLQRHYLAKPLN